MTYNIACKFCFLAMIVPGVFRHTGMKLLELCFTDCTTMPPLTHKKGKLPHTCHIWVIFDTNGNLGTPQGVRVLQMARKWHRCHNTRVWSSNSNTTKGRQPFSSCSFTFIKDQRLSDILIKKTQQPYSNAFCIFNKLC